MKRPALLLPLLTTSLPIVAGTVPALHGALAGLLALTSPFVVDAFCSRSGLRFDERTPPPPVPRRWYALLFHVYAFAFVIAFARFALQCGSLPWIDVLGGGFTWVVLSGVPTLIVGHAFIHSRSRFERIVGQALFSLLDYPAFPLLHVESHHRHVATAHDVHSAPKGQTFYRFFGRYLVGEARTLPTLKKRRRFAVLTCIRVLLCAGITLHGGLRALGIYLGVTFLARGVVALVNYVQHYGLERAHGQKPGLDHAWDLPFKSGNWLYFNAGLHVEHHMKASLGPADLAFKSTRYVLPHNIQIILPLALVPPLFFRTMDPILEGATHPGGGPDVGAVEASA